MSTTLIIARHGNTFAASDVVRRVGTTDLPLVDTGLEQGRQLGIYLKQHKLIPHLLFTSKLKRTIQTAEQAQSTMGTHLPIRTLSIFNEIDYGPDENQPEEQVIQRIGKDAINAWEAKASVPQGWQVNPEDIIKHWLDFATHLREEYQGKTVLVITSNGIARFSPYLTGDFAQFSTKYGIKIATGSLCIFTNEERSTYWNCTAWNVKP